MNKYSFITPSYGLIIFLYFHKLNYFLKIIGISILLCLYFLAFISLSKFNVLILVLGCTLGYMSRNFSLKKLIISAFILFTVFFTLNPIFTIARNHNLYHDLVYMNIDHRPDLKGYKRNSIILYDSTLSIFGYNNNQIQMPVFGMKKKYYGEDSSRSDSLIYSLFNRILLRFDVIPVQSFIINEYDSGDKAETLSEIWTIFIPRTLWKNKPNLSRHGNNLYYKMFGDESKTTSALAPTYSGESYWNFGYIGVICISFLLGCILNFLSFMHQSTKNNRNIAFLFICPYLLALICKLEGWIVGTIFGELIILLSLFIVIYFVYGFSNKFFNKFSS